MFRRFDSHCFFNGRWSDPGVPFGPWRAMVEKCAYRAFGGLLSSPITTARFLAPCPHTPLPTFPNHPLSHPCQAAPRPNLANSRSMKCIIYNATKVGPMCTLRRSWSLFNETAACPRSFKERHTKQRHTTTTRQTQPLLLRAATRATHALLVGPLSRKCLD